jgi:hypothetical protein
MPTLKGLNRIILRNISPVSYYTKFHEEGTKRHEEVKRKPGWAIVIICKTNP